MRSLLLFLCLSLVGLLVPPPSGAQPGQGGPPGLFTGTGETGPSSMNAVGRRRMATLKEDSTTLSIRLVRIAGNLSQRRTLVMHVGGNRSLAPEVPPAFQREHPGREQAETPGQGKAKTPGRRRGNQKTKLFIRRDEINPIREGTYAWKGTVQIGSAGREGKKETVGEVMLVRGKDGEITGTVRLGGEFYLVRPLSESLHALVEVDESKYSSESINPLHDGGGSFQEDSQSSSKLGKALSTSQSARRSSKQTCLASTASSFRKSSNVRAPNSRPQNTASCSSGADVLVVYTSNAADGRNISNLIDMAFQEANDTYSNSNVYNVDLNLVHSQEVSIGGVGNGSIGNDLGDLRSSSTVQSLRNQYDADVVVLLTDNGYFNRNGRRIYGISDEIRAEDGDAYALVEAPYATGGKYTFTHEIGHLQGAQHLPNNACPKGNSACDPEGHIFPDAYGDWFVDEGWCGWLCDSYYSTMMVSNYSTVKHFSNPNVKYKGNKTGTSSRYNADALRTTANTVEDFRISNDLQARFSITTTDPLGDERTFTANPCGGTGSYNYEWRFSYNGPGNYGAPVSSSKSYTQSFPEGTHYAKLTVTSGSQSDTAIQSFYVSGDGTYKSHTAGAQDSTDAPSGKAAETSTPPEQVVLRGPAPNPVQTSAELTYALPERTEVTLVVYDLMGRQVATLATGTRSAGTHRARLEGVSLPSGTYVVRLRAGEVHKSRRVTVVK